MERGRKKTRNIITWRDVSSGITQKAQRDGQQEIQRKRKIEIGMLILDKRPDQTAYQAGNRQGQRMWAWPSQDAR